MEQRLQARVDSITQVLNADDFVCRAQTGVGGSASCHRGGSVSLLAVPSSRRSHAYRHGVPCRMRTPCMSPGSTSRRLGALGRNRWLCTSSRRWATCPSTRRASRA